MSASVIEAGQGVVQLQGELDFISVIALRKQLDSSLKAAGAEVTLDFSQVTRVNSVGLSLILHAARSLESEQRSLRVSGLPQGLQSMAAVCGLDEWLAKIAAPASAG